MTFLGKVGDVFFFIIAYPCVVAYLFLYSDGSSAGTGEAARRSRRHENATKAAMKQRKKNEPPLHISISPEISISPPTEQVKADLFKRRTQKATPQQAASTSRLLNLPFEIREQIYLSVLGHKTFHIVQLPKRLGHHTCTSTTKIHTHDNIICPRSCMHSPQTYRHGEALDMQGTSSNHLSLLQTCRQIYHEATPLLYQTNTFDINHPQTLLFLARTILPTRLASIRHLHLTWSGSLPFIENDVARSPDDLSTWLQTWHIIGHQMPALRTLKIRMLIYDDEIEKSRSGPFLMHARKRWTTNEVQFERLLEVVGENVRGLQEGGFGLGVELPEEVVWDVGALEGRIRGVVCGERSSGEI